MIHNVCARIFNRKVFSADEVNMVYSMYDRMIVGGAMPVNESLHLEAIEPLKQAVYLHSREIGIYNVGGKGKVKVGNDVLSSITKKRCIWVQETGKFILKATTPKKPAKFYFNSATAHRNYPDKKSDQGRCGGCRNGLPRRLKPSEYQ